MTIGSFVLAAFTLVGAEKSAKVVIPDNAEPSTRLCVEELTNYVAKISGEILEVEKVGGGGQWNCRNSFVIGTLTTLGDAAPKQAREALAKSEYYDSAWIGTLDGNLWIIGKETTGDLYATYHFLETKLGVRWFQAATKDDPGDYYPSQKTIVIDDYTEFREPDFKYRALSMNGAYYNVLARPGIECAIRNGYTLSTSFWWIDKNPERYGKVGREFTEFYAPRVSIRGFVAGGGHGIFFESFPRDKYFPLHPDWFPLINGKRQPSHGQCCMSNTNLLQAIVDKALARFELTGGKGCFIMGNVDNTQGWCECDACRALDNGPKRNCSNRMCFMTSYIAPRIWAKYPEAVVTSFPYSDYREIPTKGTYDLRHECQYCDHGRCYGHALDDPNCIRNVTVFEDMKKWLKIQPKLWTFEYFTDTPPKYICRERDEQRDLQLYKKLGMIGWYNEGFMTGSRFVGNEQEQAERAETQPSNWQWLYATGHLFWDVDLDLDALLEDAETKYYGVAAKPMREYHNLRRNLWNSRRECMGYPAGDPRRPLLLNADGSKEKLLAYLDEADRLADSAILKYRLSRDRKWLTKYWIKPNEKARKMAGNALKVPTATTPIKIDGNGGDAAWCGALYPNHLLRLQAERELGRGEVPPELKTSVGMLTDGSNLYFLVTAKEPHPEKIKTVATAHDGPAWGDDGVEIMIFSPSVENCYYHIGVNTKGVVYDARCPGNDKSYDLGVEAKGKVDADSWTIEVRIPTEKIYPLVQGDKWRIQVARNATTYGTYGGAVSFFGALPHMTQDYPSFEFGESCCGNGGFDEVDAKTNKPKDWLVNSGEIRKEGVNNVLFTKGFTYYGFRHGPLGLSDKPRKLKYSFRAKLAGPAKDPRISCWFVRYDPEQRSGKWMPEPRGFGGTYTLTNEWRVFTGSYTVNPHEWAAISFSPPREGCLMDDVNVIKEE